MKKELINAIENLIAAKNTKAIEIINWCWNDGSGDYYYIVAENGNVYDLHQIGGFASGFGLGARHYDRKYSIAKVSKKDYNDVINQNERIIKERVRA